MQDSVTQPWTMPREEPWLAAAEVIGVLVAAGHQAVFVGGCVRDQLLGQAVHDCDIATNADPQAVEDLFTKTVAVGKAFGVIVVVHRGYSLEVASFRDDGAYIDGRRPTAIRRSDECRDVQRRDFTINALIADPQRGEIRDHVGGLRDLQQRCLRVVGDPQQRLREDRLRVLRALRFAAQCDCQIEAASAQALREITVQGLSRERIWDEWHKGLRHPARERWWELVVAYDLVAAFVPPATVHRAPAAGWGRLSPRAAAAYLIAHHLNLDAGDDGCTALAGWLTQEPISGELRQCLSNIHRQRLAWLADPQVLQALRLAREAEAGLVAELLVLDGSEQAQRLRRTMTTEAQRGPIPRLLSGADLRGAGLAPGPAFARILRAVDDAWLLGTITNRDEALAQLSQWISEHSTGPA